MTPPHPLPGHPGPCLCSGSRCIGEMLARLPRCRFSFQKDDLISDVSFICAPRVAVGSRSPAVVPTTIFSFSLLFLTSHLQRTPNLRGGSGLKHHPYLALLPISQHPLRNAGPRGRPAREGSPLGTFRGGCERLLIFILVGKL